MSCISVVVPTYNRADLLDQALESVLAQTHSNFELIVVDDGSTDSTCQVVQPYLSDARVRYVFQANQGRSAARNNGARLAQGNYLAFLDSDDCFLPDALASHWQTVERVPDLGMALGAYQYVNAAGAPVGERLPWQEGGVLTLRDWLFNCFGMPGSILVQRSWFERLGGFDATTEIAEDWDLFLRLAVTGCRMEWTHALVCQYRLHAGNSIRALEMHRLSSLRALDHAFEAPNLPTDILPLENSARAWVNVVFAKKSLLAGQTEEASRNLRTALHLDPWLADDGRLVLLECLLSPPVGWDGRADALALRVQRCIGHYLPVGPRDMRRARARVAMARFFQSTETGDWRTAYRAFPVAVWNDAAWLGNKGALKLWLKAASRHVSAASWPFLAPFPRPQEERP